MLRTNTPLPPEEVALSYKGLWQVERAFRTLKTPLEIRPVYHWQERRVRGHVVSCVLAYFLGQAMEQKLKAAGMKMSADQALEVLKGIRCVEIRLNDRVCRYTTELTPDQRQILDVLKVPKPPRIQVVKSAER